MATNLWSYWDSTSSSLGTYPSSIALMPSFIPNCGGGTSCWDDAAGPNVLVYNPTASAVTTDGGASFSASKALTFFTRNGLTLVRFLVPTTGLYAISAAFTGEAMSPSVSTDEIAITSGGTVLSTLLSKTGSLAFGSSNSISNVLQALTAGETVDFLVSGTSGNNSTATGFTATIDVATPEPATLLLTMGGLGLLILRRRKRAS